jgi:hypothetical protein
LHAIRVFIALAKSPLDTHPFAFTSFTEALKTIS